MADLRETGTGILTLRRDDLVVEVDRGTGAITACGRGGLQLVGRPSAAGSWRLLVPLPERAGHHVHGHQQALRALQASESGAVLTWGPLRSDAGELDIEIELSIELGDGEVAFQASLANRSPYTVEELLAPCLGGVVQPPDPSAWRIVGPRVISGGFEYPVFDVVPSSYHGPPRSNILHPYPGGWTQPLSLGMPWVALERADGSCIYVGNHDPEVAFSAFWIELDAELRLDAGDQSAFGSSAPQRWAGSAGSLSLGWASFPFAAPGARFEGPPTVVRFEPSGGWRAGAARFRRERPVDLVPRRTWLGESDGWVVLCLRFNDGTIRHRLDELPRLAEEAVAHGITTLLVCGWSVGGLDGAYPFYRVDPSLGTPEDLAAAMAGCREAGARVILQAQLVQLHVETDWFASEGHRYVVQNPRGDPYHGGGVFYGFNTLLGQLGYTAPQMVTGDLAHPALRALVLDELEAIVAVGADGVLLDKVNTGDPYSLDFNPDLPGTPSTRFHRSLLETIVEFVERAAHPDGFAIAIESGWDRVMPYCETVYSRYFEREHLPVQEVVFPDVRLTTTIVGDDDLPMVNNALRHGHVICLEPRYMHGAIADVPRLAAYTRETIALRRRLRSILWDGAPVATDAVTVAGDVLAGVFAGEPHGPDDGHDGLAVVLNHFEREPVGVQVTFDGAWASADLHRPFRAPEAVSLPLATAVPADEYLVVVPRRAGPRGAITPAAAAP